MTYAVTLASEPRSRGIGTSSFLFSQCEHARGVE